MEMAQMFGVVFASPLLVLLQSADGR